MLCVTQRRSDQAESNTEMGMKGAVTCSWALRVRGQEACVRATLLTAASDGGAAAAVAKAAH